MGYRPYFQCRGCPRQVRTRDPARVQLGLCPSCQMGGMRQANTPQDGVLLDLGGMPEAWWHSLFYKQILRNGFASLGLGPLSLYSASSKLPMASERQQHHEGRWNSSWWGDGWEGDIYDALLTDRQSRLVGLEYKVLGTEAGLVQAARYKRTLKRRTALEGRPGHLVYLICFDFDPGARDAYLELRAGWPTLKVLQIQLAQGGIRLMEVGNEDAGRAQEGSKGAGGARDATPGGPGAGGEEPLLGEGVDPGKGHPERGGDGGGGGGDGDPRGGARG